MGVGNHKRVSYRRRQTGPSPLGSVCADGVVESCGSTVVVVRPKGREIRTTTEDRAVGVPTEDVGVEWVIMVGGRDVGNGALLVPPSSRRTSQPIKINLNGRTPSDRRGFV